MKPRDHLLALLSRVVLFCLFFWVHSPVAAAGVNVDFRVALAGIHFDPMVADGNGGETGDPNGILDATEMALVAAVLQQDTLDLSASGGVDYATVKRAYLQTLESAGEDLVELTPTFKTVVSAVTGYIMIGTQESFAAINAMTTSFGGPLQGDYSRALEIGKYFGPDGDADGDGYSNRLEHDVFAPLGIDRYLEAALNPSVHPTKRQVANAPIQAKKMSVKKKNVGIILYPGFEVLDVYGPVEMWSYVREFNILMVAQNAGPVKSAQGTTTVADYSFDSAPHLDIIMVPGGFGTRPELKNEIMIHFLQERNKTSDLTTSVCTGSALLAKAGLLTGRKATTNKRFFSLAASQDSEVDWVTEARWVDDGKFVTSSGVSAGIDMALYLISRLFGKERADAIASSVEYIWHDDPADDPFSQFVGTH